MDAKRVCKECAQNCLLVHGQKLDPSSVDNSFIALLNGDYEFSEFLYLPPRVSKTIPALKDGEYHMLEDYTGKRWLVTLGISHGALAFEKGWYQFFADHELKKGYTLQFNYMRSHFVVKIYDTTGTQKLRFKENRNKGKRSATGGGPEVEGPKVPNALTRSPVSNSVAPGSGDNRMQGQPVTMNEPPNSETGDGRLRRPLTTFRSTRAEKDKESQATAKDKDSGAQKGSGKFKLPPTTSPKTSTKSGRESQVKTKDKPVCSSVVSGLNEVIQTQLKLDGNQVSRKVLNGEPPAEVADKAQTKRQLSVVDNDDHDDLSVIPLKKRAVLRLRTEYTTKTSLKSKTVDFQQAEGSNKHSSELKLPEKEPMDLGEMPSNEQLNSGKHLNDKISSGSETGNEFPSTVNAEPVESPYQEILDESRESCKAVVESEAMLKLPVSLPLISFREGTGKKVVFLRGVVRPDEQLWSALYVERHGLNKALIDGWKNFYDSNALQKGDECTFVHEKNESDPIYKVTVVRKVDL